MLAETALTIPLGPLVDNAGVEVDIANEHDDAAMALMRRLR